MNYHHRFEFEREHARCKKRLTYALSLEAHAPLAIGIRVAIIGGANAAVLRPLRGRDEFMDTLATRLAVYHVADRIRAASVLARVGATMVVADGVRRAILGRGAVTLRLAPFPVRIPDEVGRALAHWIVGRAWDADGRLVARVQVACLDRHALDLGDRIRFQAGRALAYRPVVVRYANGVRPASVLVAGVVAGVGQPVAELGGRAVDVVDAGHGLATADSVVGVARVQPRGAFAVGHVVVDHAQSVRPARDEIAHRLTREQPLPPAPARLVLGALGVRRAPIPPPRLAPVPIVRIARETGQTLATPAMPLRHASRVGGAREAPAHRGALQHAERIGSARLHSVTIVVRYAVGDRGFLAGRGHGIPLVAVLTLAGGVAGARVRLALLMGAAHEFAARVNALAAAAVFEGDAERAGGAVGVVVAARRHRRLGRLATLHQVARVPRVAVHAQARGRVVLGDAQRVRAALQLAARVHALSHPLPYLEADLLGLAVEVVGAVAVKAATFGKVVRVARVTGRADAGPVLADRSRPAFHVAATIYALAAHAAVVERAGHRVGTGAGRGVGARLDLDLLATDERIAEEVFLATAVVAADRVDAHRVAPASVPVALVDIWNFYPIFKNRARQEPFRKERNTNRGSECKDFQRIPAGRGIRRRSGQRCNGRPCRTARWNSRISVALRSRDTGSQLCQDCTRTWTPAACTRSGRWSRRRGRRRAVGWLLQIQLVNRRAK